MKYETEIRRQAKLKTELKDAQHRLQNLIEENSKLKAVFESLMHESRRFSGDIAEYSEALLTNIKKIKEKLPNGKLANAESDAENIFYTAGLLSARMAFADLELNPKILNKQIRVRSGIYKKFHKAKRLLSIKTKHNSLSISLIGNSTLEVETLQAFELVPYVLLENAIKYSPPNQEIKVNFSEILNRELEVIVSSIGPYVKPEETDKIFERGVRAESVMNTSISGEGLGLYLAKTLCDLNGFHISASSSQETSYTLSLMPYATFEVKLAVKQL